MSEPTRPPSGHIVGRDVELALLRELLGADLAPRALLTGKPGIGKTSLWEAGVDWARERRVRVLSARPSDAEAQLSFTSFTDLLEGIETDAVAGVPAPQRRALEMALLRAEPTGEPPEPRAISLGFLNVLRAQAARGPVLVAIDDVPCLDAPSGEALAFAARRLESEPVGFLLTKRSGSSSCVEQALEPKGLRKVEVGPLSLGATRVLLSERIGLSLPRRVLRQVFEASQGNPLFALMLGRTLARSGPPEIGEDIPVPDAVEDLLGTRVTQLPGRVRRLLLAVSLSAELRVPQVAAIAGADALDDAVDAHVLVVDGERVRASHPLLAAAAKRQARRRERRMLHLELGNVVVDEGLRARHLALATEHPDAQLAATVAAAAVRAAGRGHSEGAVELAEHALRLTPRDSVERGERLLALAEYLFVAGKRQHAADVLSPELSSLPPGTFRGRAHLLLADGTATSVDTYDAHLERAFVESRRDPALHATVLARKATHTAVARTERIREAEAWALAALEEARQAGPDVELPALHALAWTRSLGGRTITDLNERVDETSEDTSFLYRSLDRVEAIRLVWRGELGEARARLTRLLALADERGEAWSYAALRLHLCELELRAGRWQAAARLLEEWEQAPDEGVFVAPVRERCLGLLAAGCGHPDEVERWVAKAISGAEATGVRWDLLEAWRARGIAALLGHEPGRAVGSLRRVWEHTQREGVDDPGAFPVAPDLVEGLVEIGAVEEALAVAERLHGLAVEQGHPWGVATAARCRALVRLASSRYEEGAASALAGAASAYAQLGCGFDRARTLLVLGRARRRHRKWGAARDALERAVAAFDELGSPGWVEEARSELDRVGARRRRPAGELTPAERRVADLAAGGRSNKEIARILFVSVHTVEVHLSRTYAKLGVRSRTQLAGRLPPASKD